MTKFWNIEIKNVGKLPKLFMVWPPDGVKRPARFLNSLDATEACRVIYIIRNDTAFESAQAVSSKS